jgi:DEAD/DEAH box helicase domain-containing protein
MCKESNEVMSKAGSEVILKSLLGIEIDIDALPMGPEDASPAGIETVILAQEVAPRMGTQVEEMIVNRQTRIKEESTD